MGNTDLSSCFCIKDGMRRAMFGIKASMLAFDFAINVASIDSISKTTHERVHTCSLLKIAKFSSLM